MPATISASRDARTLQITVSGVPTADEIVDAIKEQYPTIGGRFALWDLTGASLAGFAPGDFERIAATAKMLLPDEVSRKTAYVVADDRTYVVMCKYLNAAVALGLPAEYAVFTSMQAGRDWLASA